VRTSGIATWLIGLLFALSLVACDDCATEAVPEDVRAPAPPQTREAPPDGPSIEPVVRRIEDADGARYALHRFRFDLSTTEIGVTDLEFERNLTDALEASGAVLAINGGYWDTERRPEGLTRVRGRGLAPFSDNLGGGVLVIDDGVGRLYDAEADDLEIPADVDFAQQCMPRIVVDGELNIRRNDGRRADRTALCLRDEGRTLDVYVARGGQIDGHGGPTLWTFGEVLVEEGCESALNLDGGSSTGAVWRGSARLERLPPRVDLRLAILFE
jgi:uncharacterized protein YigE (DUF2233 family)